MKKYLFILLFPVMLQAQYKWFPKLTPEQDLTFDYYSNVGLAGGVSEITNHYTHRPFLSGVCGFAAGAIRSCFERGLNGKIVSAMGSWGGQLGFIIRNDQKKKRLKRLRALNIYE